MHCSMLYELFDWNMLDMAQEQNHADNKKYEIDSCYTIYMCLNQSLHCELISNLPVYTKSKPVCKDCFASVLILATEYF